MQGKSRRHARHVRVGHAAPPHVRLLNMAVVVVVVVVVTVVAAVVVVI